VSYPFSYSRKKTYRLNCNETLFSSAFNQSILKKLEFSYITGIDTTENSIVFIGPIFRFVWNGWDLLNGVSKGRIHYKIEKNEFFIEYKIYFFESFFIALAFSIIPISVYFLPIISGVIAFIIWGLFYTGNYILSFCRFNSYINKLVEEIKKNSSIEH
jgi:hypothetical protein